ncbi:MAG: hypothetical protein P4M15_03435 [Alphaproteobacteria bacterium]|nr:hypothetical protein [Alphaproteobacteria bacterium]
MDLSPPKLFEIAGSAVGAGLELFAPSAKNSSPENTTEIATEPAAPAVIRVRIREDVRHGYRIFEREGDEKPEGQFVYFHGTGLISADEIENLAAPLVQAAQGSYVKVIAPLVEHSKASFPLWAWAASANNTLRHVNGHSPEIREDLLKAYKEARAATKGLLGKIAPPRTWYPLEYDRISADALERLRAEQKDNPLHDAPRVEAFENSRRMPAIARSIKNMVRGGAPWVPDLREVLLQESATPETTIIGGGSAGSGMTGAVLCLAPELFGAAVFILVPMIEDRLSLKLRTDKRAFFVYGDKDPAWFLLGLTEERMARDMHACFAGGAEIVKAPGTHRITNEIAFHAVRGVTESVRRGQARCTPS